MENKAGTSLSIAVSAESTQNGLDVPRPTMAKTSPCSSPYFKKLPPLSPRSIKMLDPSYNYTEFAFPRDSASSSESAYSSYDSGYSTTPGGDTQGGFEHSRKPSTSSNTDDIDFFLQVVGVFREYTTDQINALESKMKENQIQLETLQQGLKAAENEASVQETQLKRDIGHLISILHRRQVDLSDKLKKRNADTVEEYKEKMDMCRRNVKLITGVLNFAKRLRNESEESMRENAVRELKQRLTIACDLTTPETPEPGAKEARIHVESLERFMRKIDFSPNADSAMEAPVVLAAHPDDEASSNSVVVRWHYKHPQGSYDLRWWYPKKGNIVQCAKDGIVGQQHTLTDLPRNCKISVKVKFGEDAKENWSEVACFRTLPAPAKFTFDASTAHSKLKISSDANTVFYPGEDQCATSSPKSPSRFTFALNVLGNISFYSGRHYWEVAVNRDGWAVGVASRNIPRNSWLGSNESSWILHYNASKFEYKVRSAGEACVVTPKLSDPRQYLRRVGIFLDYDAGIIKFVNCKNEEVIHTYTVDGFSESLCAAVNPFYHGGGLTLLSGLNVPKYLL